MLVACGALGSDRFRPRWGAESLDAAVRLITAPQPGIFLPLDGLLYVPNCRELAVGEPIGVVVRSNQKRPVCSQFTGRWMGLLVLPGERVRLHQPLAWLTAAEE